MKKLMHNLFASLLTGASVALVYFVFSAVVDQLQDFIWFTLFDTSENKILAIPVAVCGATVLAITLKAMAAKGHQEIGHNLTGFAAKANQINLNWLMRSLLVGAVSLIAGASLGPEAILLPVSYGIAYIIAKKIGVSQPAQFGFIGIIVLLAAFFNAYAAALFPLAFISFKKSADIKKSIMVIGFGLVAIATGLGVLRLLHDREGYIYLSPIGDVTITPFLIGIAVVVAAVATLIPLLLDALVVPLQRLYDRLNRHWLIGAVVAGLGIGIFYFLLGPIAYFSGHSGLGELLKDNSELTSLQLAGLAIGKLLITAWSLATIYRGGVVFPQLMVGMSIALLLSGGIPDSSWLFTLLVASFFGIFTGALGSVIVAIAFVVSLFGIPSLPLVAAAVVGSLLIKLLFRRQFAAKSAL